MVQEYEIEEKGEQIVIRGYMANVASQCPLWDARCMEKDVEDYNNAYYSRMNPIQALRQEMEWWLDFVSVTEENLELGEIGFEYLYQMIKKDLVDCDSKILTVQQIQAESQYLMIENDHCVVVNGDESDYIAGGLPVYLMSCAATETIQKWVRAEWVDDEEEMIAILADILKTPHQMDMRVLQMEIANVREQIDAYMSQKKDEWDAMERKYIAPTQEKRQDFITSLMEEVQGDWLEAELHLYPMMSCSQREAMSRYKKDWEVYVQGKKPKRNIIKPKLRNPFYGTMEDGVKHIIVRELKKAARTDKPIINVCNILIALREHKRIRPDLKAEALRIWVMEKTKLPLDNRAHAKHFSECLLHPSQRSKEAARVWWNHFVDVTE